MVSGNLKNFLAAVLFFSVFPGVGGIASAGGPREFRPIETKGAESPASTSSSARRTLPDGEVKAFSTGARSERPEAGSTGFDHPRSALARAKHAAQLESDLRRLGMRLGDPVFLRFFKEENEMELWVRPRGASEFSLFRVYRIARWSGNPGPKMAEGDRQAPEGFYYVPASRMIPENAYHMGFDLGFPNAYDRFHGRTGSDVLVHGSRVSHSSYAMTDEKIEEIYVLAEAALKRGESFFRVHCFPFRMMDEVMDGKIEQHPEHEDFWANLKEGYDFFEVVKRPPNVEVSRDGRYRYSRE